MKCKVKVNKRLLLWWVFAALNTIDCFSQQEVTSRTETQTENPKLAAFSQEVETLVNTWSADVSADRTINHNPHTTHITAAASGCCVTNIYCSSAAETRNHVTSLTSPGCEGWENVVWTLWKTCYHGLYCLSPECCVVCTKPDLTACFLATLQSHKLNTPQPGCTPLVVRRPASGHAT